jgi:hypothetical protein
MGMLIRDEVKHIAACSEKGICITYQSLILWEIPLYTHLSMGVVKVDSCVPDWDSQAMMEAKP